jgi:hypothetical protein
MSPNTCSTRSRSTLIHIAKAFASILTLHHHPSYFAAFQPQSTNLFMTTIYAEAAEWVQSALPPNSSHPLLVAGSDRHDPTTKDGSRRIKGRKLIAHWRYGRPGLCTQMNQLRLIPILPTQKQKSHA